jgi:hypothetical protein
MIDKHLMDTILIGAATTSILLSTGIYFHLRNAAKRDIEIFNVLQSLTDNPPVDPSYGFSSLGEAIQIINSNDYKFKDAEYKKLDPILESMNLIKKKNRILDKFRKRKSIEELFPDQWNMYRSSLYYGVQKKKAALNFLKNEDVQRYYEGY